MPAKTSAEGARPGGRRAARPRGTRIIAVANQKGGVGKSTTAVSIGAALAEIGHKVLVVDLDPQGNASTGLGIRHETRDLTVYDVLAAEAPIDGAVMETPVPGLFAIASTIDLAGAEIELVSQFSRELRLRRALEPLRQSDYDFIFLDCPPSLGLLTVNALAAAGELIVPIQCEYYALEGLGQLLRNVGLVQQNVNPSLRLTGIVMTMYDSRTRLSEQVLAEVRRYFGKRVYKTVIPRTVRLSEAPGFGRPITVYDPSSRGAASYRDLAREVARRLPSDEPLPRLEELPAIRHEFEPATAPRAMRPDEPPNQGFAGVAEPEAPAEMEEEPVGGGDEVSPTATPDLEPEARTTLGATVPVPGDEPAEPAGHAPEREPDIEPPSSGERLESARPAEATPEPEGRGETHRVAVEEPPPTVAAPPRIEVEVSSIPSEAAPEEQGVQVAAARVTEGPPPHSEGTSRGPDEDGTEEWIAAMEAEGRSEAEPQPPDVVTPSVREIDLEPEAGAPPPVEPSEVIRIEDRDAAGDHEPSAQTNDQGPERVKRRWALFRRGGDR